MTDKIRLIGAPSSAGAHAPGQEKAPAELRKAGLIKDLAEAGLSVEDCGDLPGYRYSSDKTSPRARNIESVVTNARRVLDFVATTIATGNKYIVIGGDCTNGVGSIAGAMRDESKRTGVIYLDMHGDMNTPKTVDSGALDWMGVAHMLGFEGTVKAFAELDGRSPILQNEQIVLLGWDYQGCNSDGEREAIIRRNINVVCLDELQNDPVAAAKRAMKLLGKVDQVVVHFDVDVIDFSDCPLSENYRHGEGCSLEDATKALSTIASTETFTGVTVAQLNPDHGESERATLKRFSKAFSKALAGKC